MVFCFWVFKDPKTESRLSLIESLQMYVPRDERFGHLKRSDFLAYGLEAVFKFLLPEFEAITDDTIDEFDSFDDVLKLYKGGIKLPKGPLHDRIRENIPLQVFKELIRSDGEGLAKYSTPDVIKGTISTCSKLNTQVIDIIKYHKKRQCDMSYDVSVK